MKYSFTHLLLLLALSFQVGTISATDHANTTDLNQQLSLANELTGKAQYQQAYRELLKYAEHNELAQFNLGIMELYGWGREINQSAACEWFEKSAKKNIPMAQELLGDCYRDGLHRTASFDLAKKWYLRAAGNGIFTSYCKLGKVYVEGEIVEKNQRQGIRLCEQAGAANAVQAQLYLARNFDHGGEFTTDMGRALYWYSAAAVANNAEAQYRIAELLASGEVNATEPQKAVELAEAAASKGYTDAYLLAARLYFEQPLDPHTSLPTPANLAKAYMWSQASLRDSNDETDRTEARRMLAQIRSVMPETWEKYLDGEVDDHFNRLKSAAEELE